MGWVRDALVDLEEVCYAATEDLPFTAPILTRPALRLHFGIIQEHEMGLYGSQGRRALEANLLQSFVSRFHTHIASMGPARAGQEGSSASQYDVLFRRDADSVQARQNLRDQGYYAAQAPDALVVIPVRDGPGRLPSSLTKIVISNLPADFMTPGVTKSLLESAGYETGGVGERGDGPDVAIRAEFGGEQKPEISARFPTITKLGVVVAIVRTPPDDPGLAALPRKLQDNSSDITIAISGHQVRKSSPLQGEGTQVPGFIAQQQPNIQVDPNPQRIRLQRPLDAITDLRSRRPHDRRGLGATGPAEQAAGPIFGSFHGFEATASARAHEATASARAHPQEGNICMEVDPPTAPTGAQLLLEGPTSEAANVFTPDVQMIDPRHDPTSQILAELDEPNRHEYGYPSGPMSEACHTWLLDNEVARDHSEAVDILAHFYLTYTPLWETFAEDGSSPPHPRVLKTMLMSTQSMLTTATVDGHANAGLPRQPPAPVVIPPPPPGFSPQDVEPVRQGHRRQAGQTPRNANQTASQRPKRTHHPLPWYHTDRLKGGPRGSGPRGRPQ